MKEDERERQEVCNIKVIAKILTTHRLTAEDSSSDQQEKTSGTPHFCCVAQGCHQLRRGWVVRRCGKLGGGTGGKQASLSLLLGVGWGGQCFSI